MTVEEDRGDTGKNWGQIAISKGRMWRNGLEGVGCEREEVVLR